MPVNVAGQGVTDRLAAAIRYGERASLLHRRMQTQISLFLKKSAIDSAATPPSPAPADPTERPVRPVCERISAWLIARRRILAVVAIALAFMGVERSGRLEFARSIDTMFDRADPALVPYRRMARAFGSSEVVLAAYDAPDLFTPAGIERLGAVTAALAATPGIASATSLASTPLGRRIIDVDESPTARKLVKLMEGYTLGADHRTAAIACVLQPPAASALAPMNGDSHTTKPPRFSISPRSASM